MEIPSKKIVHLLYKSLRFQTKFFPKILQKKIVKFKNSFLSKLLN